MLEINKHISEYINYYLNSKIHPGFAVLLQGKWGSGKTWFIKNFIRKKSTQGDRKFIYLTLYGISSTNEIDYQIFQKLHPILSSKQMALAGKILRGFSKGVLKIDLDGDDRSDGSVNLELPTIDIPDYLKNASNCVLIVDDLERCVIPLNRLFGYINSFVEHQGLKVIVIANEDELCAKEKDNTDSSESYKKIKEKLIGKTFRVEHDFESAFNETVSLVCEGGIKDFFIGSKEKIKKVFDIAGYHNLRHLKQCLWDFERFYGSVPEKYTSNAKLMEDVLIYFLAFLFEIKAGKIDYNDISQIRSAVYRQLSSGEDGYQPMPIDVVMEKYPFIEAGDLLLEENFWRSLFDKGYLLDGEIENLLDRTKYFINDNMPALVKIWHYVDLEDDEFVSTLKDLLSQWENMELVKPSEISEVGNILLHLSSIGLIKKSPKDVLSECKQHIDNMVVSGKFKGYHRQSQEVADFLDDPLSAVGSHGHTSAEFKEFVDYYKKIIDMLFRERLPEEGANLLNILSEDTSKFSNMICLSNTEDEIYCNIPIFKYIDPTDFINKLLVLSNRNRKEVFRALIRRYKFIDKDSAVIDDVGFLETLCSLIKKRVDIRDRKLSSYLIYSFKDIHLDKIIEKLKSYAENGAICDES